MWLDYRITKSSAYGDNFGTVLEVVENKPLVVEKGCQYLVENLRGNDKLLIYVNIYGRAIIMNNGSLHGRGYFCKGIPYKYQGFLLQKNA